MSSMIEVSGLKKSYGSRVALQGIDFSLEQGQMLALLGTNGAGKSTLISVLSTLLKADSGRIKVDGFEVGRQDEQIRKRIGIVFQDSMLDKTLTVRENLTCRGRLYSLRGKALKEAICRVTEYMHMEAFLDQDYGRLSGGQRRRADIARALLQVPTVLFLDEPTTGLDPGSKEDLWKVILELKKQDKMTILLTSHYMEEAQLADQIIFMRKGSIIDQGTVTSLKRKYTLDNLSLETKTPLLIRDKLSHMGLSFREYEETDGRSILEVALSDSKAAIRILNLLENEIMSFELRHGSMEEVFLTLMGGQENV